MNSVNFNTNHPELCDNEIFLCNVDSEYTISSTGSVLHIEPELGLMMNFNKIQYKTKRIGTTAYTHKGAKISEERPVFVNKLEFEQKTYLTRKFLFYLKYFL